MTELNLIVGGFLGSLGFAFLYNIRGKRLVGAAMGGMLCCALFCVLGLFIDSEPIIYFIVSVVTSIYAEILSRVLKTPTTTFIITALIPLIPGGSLYYTMSSAFEGDFDLFLSNAISTLLLALALALGVCMVIAGTRFVLRIKAWRVGLRK
jgi:uncharacterized membrane protein YjjB (DUF3815 family)